MYRLKEGFRNRGLNGGGWGLTPF